MEQKDISRRSFLRRSTAVGAGATTFTIVKPELVRGFAPEKLKAGLVGCGGRGTQAAQQLLHGNPNVELVAMGDIFEDKLESSLKNIRDNRKYPNLAGRVKVTPEQHFVGFDAYKKVLASDIDVVILATPPGHRPEHFVAAVEAGKHIFSEKPFGTDPVGVRKVMAAAEKARQLKLTVMSGAQRRNQKPYVETWEKVKNGAIGDIAACYAYWVGTPVVQQKNGRDPKWGDMTWQHRNWYSFVWICGDQVVEQHLHNIDVCNWVMGTHPVKVVASGGAVWRPRNEIYGNIYDHLTADFVYANGEHMSSHCRQYPKGCYQDVSELAIGTKGRSNCHDMGSGTKQDVRKGFHDPLENPYVREHMALVASIRGDGPYINHAMTVAESTMTCIMAREAAYSGLEITWDMIMNSKLDLMPKTFGYDEKMTVPPLPVPGEYKFI
ncbi:MAG: Gfo/Idh/MocA family oxidoreductase [Bryobacteraceae bacterium]